MRYQIGEKLFVLGFYHDGTKKTPSIWSSLGAVIAQPELNWSFKIIELTVTEHHKVPWNQDPEGKKECDGYILKDKDGVVYYNQYPAASYGQLSDFANRVFTVYLENYSAEKLKQHFETHKVVRYVLVQEYYEQMKDWDKNGFDPEKSDFVKDMVAKIEHELLDKFNVYLVPESIYPDVPEIIQYTVRYHPQPMSSYFREQLAIA